MRVETDLAATLATRRHQSEGSPPRLAHYTMAAKKPALTGLYVFMAAKR